MPGTRCINYRELKSLRDGMVRDHGEREGSRRLRAHVAEALEQKHLRPRDFSVAETFEALVPEGRSIIDRWRNPKSYRAEVTEGASSSAVGYSDFSEITGQIFFTEVKDQYDDEELVFSKMVEHRSSSLQDIERIPNITRTGKGRRNVGEGDSYPRYGVGQDYFEVPAKVKDGGIVEVTKEAIFGDKTGMLLDQCRMLGYDLAYNLEERIIDALIDENAGAASAHAGGHRYTWRGTAYATYQASAPWANKKTSNALTDETSVDALWQLLAAITDPFTGRPIRVMPDTLIVTPDLLWKASRIVRSTEVRQTAPGYATSGSPVQTVSPPALHSVIPGLKLASSRILKSRLATDTDFFLGNPGKAVRRYYNWDITTQEMGSGSWASFDRDVVSMFRADLKDAVATVEPRVMAKSSA